MSDPCAPCGGAPFDDTILLVSALAANAVRHGPVPEWDFEVAALVGAAEGAAGP
ncbi:hypothetical protein [Streptomyces himalayensis]|uniref:Uncharacterized protein n=1 Tax=Streptomyces himalayensis subsp. himalayensis TaxID=2756131 RepID=A0A7W0DPL2_9ACTN|nr:hypothetical protein [Streptomyces himalayensis]MBA2948929.1 hypothetical protein [Streptomyces himalayensis subsp. himalayensis]